MAPMGRLIIVVVLLVMAHPGGIARADGVRGSDAQDVFVVHAGGSGFGGTAEPGTGGCTGCATTIAVPVCVSGIQFASPQPGSGCLTVGSRDCDTGEQFVREWTAGPAGWIQGGVSCQDLTGAPTIDQIAAEVRARVLHEVPSPAIVTQPARDPLIRVPVLLDTGQPDRAVVWQDVVAGVPVTATVSASWRWSFSDGHVMTTDQAGSRWPDTTVSHVFQTPGAQQVRVRSTWSGTFRIAGLAQQDIAGVVSQESERTLHLRTAGAVLQRAIR